MTMVEFRKITEPEIDHKAVNLTILKEGSAINGKSIGPLYLGFNASFGTELGGPPVTHLPIAEALREATRVAEQFRTHVNVIDPRGLWQPSWGHLRLSVSV
jgi:hypothetical protein